ncbi:shikimate kinase [Methylibium sp.]|uniref:shikimate kinase n=1 Tax=Methylibium sp. TaxID=2067992 RepID=UPI0039C985B8
MSRCRSRTLVLLSDLKGPAQIALVGMPGAGKSSVGRQLAKRLGIAFADADAVIEHRLNESILSFFEREGEARFRYIEQAVIADLCARPGPMVLATGGGAVLREANRQVLARSAVVVYLHASPDELYRRLRCDTKRPLLQTADPHAVLSKMYFERDPLYRQISRFLLETGRPTAKALVEKIVVELQSSGYL